MPKGGKRKVATDEERKRLEKERSARRRAAELEEQRAQRLADQRNRQSNLRSRETPAQAAARRQADAVRHAAKRAVDRERISLLPRMLAIQQIGSARFDETLVQEHSCGRMDRICRYCGARHFAGELPTDGQFTNCCQKGKVILPEPRDEHGNVLQYPAFLQSLLSNPSDPNYRNFRENIRSYNSSVSFASMGAKTVEVPGRGPYCFKVNGTIYHRTSHLQPAAGQGRQFAQLYILDSTQALPIRSRHAANADCLPAIMDRIDRFFRANNRLCQTYHMMRTIQEREAAEAVRDGREIPVVHMVMRRDRELDSIRFNLPTSNEIAMVFVDENGEPPFERDIRIYEINPRNRNQQFIHLSILSPNLDPMTYAILYPYGQPGWHDKLRINNQKVSLLQYKVFQMATRDSFNAVMSAGKLTQQWLVDSYLQVEANDLHFIRTHQSNLRRELYQGLHDYLRNVANERGVPAGLPVILPSTFAGSSRNMRERVQDAFAIFGKFGPMDAFKTFTANPKWHEITAELRPGETASDRPELVAKVFKLKLKELIKDFTVDMVLGFTLAWVYTIEFQKRGLPHAHIIVVFHDEDKFTTPEKIDAIICAELPDPTESPRLYEIVTRCMMHGPCGAANPNAPCMEDGKCTKEYPKAFAERTIQNGYPSYRRRAGSHIRVGQNILDNRSVVPYNKYLTLKYNCHINVEACTSLRAVKYIYKGFDCARVVIGQGNDQQLI